MLKIGQRVIIESQTQDEDSDIPTVLIGEIKGIKITYDIELESGVVVNRQEKQIGGCLYDS